MTRLQGLLGAGVVAVTLGLAGCWDSDEVVVHEPGEYKGDRDPLLAQDAAARDEVLKKRFEMVQMDR